MVRSWGGGGVVRRWWGSGKVRRWGANGSDVVGRQWVGGGEGCRVGGEVVETMVHQYSITYYSHSV